MKNAYDPFIRGQFPAGVRTFQATDTARERVFPCEIWYPAAARYAGQDMAVGTQDSFVAPPFNRLRPQMAVRDAVAERGSYPVVIYSHPSLFHRRAATFLCTHLASHGYLVAALDHSEVVAKELGPQKDETLEQKNARWQAVIDSRVPDARFLLNQVLRPGTWGEAEADPSRIVIVGQSAGGWAALGVPA